METCRISGGSIHYSIVIREIDYEKEIYDRGYAGCFHAGAERLWFGQCGSRDNGGGHQCGSGNHYSDRGNHHSSRNHGSGGNNDRC